jgi:hypothetical protein
MKETNTSTTTIYEDYDNNTDNDDGDNHNDSADTNRADNGVIISNCILQWL